jgi:RNA polymerase sigma factor (sigma-70 family)
MLPFQKFSYQSSVATVSRGSAPVPEERLDSCTVVDAVLDYRKSLESLAEVLMTSQVKAKVSPSDVVQDVLFIAFLKCNHWHGKTVKELRAWLVTVLRNRCYQMYRDITRRGEVSLDGLERAPIDGKHGVHTGKHRTGDPLERQQVPDPCTVYMREECRNAVNRAIMRLPVKLSIVMQMKIDEGIEVVEVAKRLGIAKSAAQKRYTRGLNQLKQMPELREIYKDLV